MLVPLAAACGAKVAKISGRGLGHTGGTLDKLESIPGCSVEETEARFVRQVQEIGCAVIGQTHDLCPADKALYALRDVTGTVDCIPLIASSIVSKKLASGAGAIVLDVKTGSGALMHTLEDSIALAKAMVDIGAQAGKPILALVTGMEQPLGTHVGNALEVKEAIDILAGRAGGDLLAVSLELGSRMLVAAGIAENVEDGKARMKRALESGAGLEKLKEMIAAQGGDAGVCDDVTRLPQAKYLVPVPAPHDGYVADMDTTAIGYCAQDLGAGRHIFVAHQHAPPLQSRCQLAALAAGGRAQVQYPHAGLHSQQRGCRGRRRLLRVEHARVVVRVASGFELRRMHHKGRFAERRHFQREVRFLRKLLRHRAQG